ncbi:MAG TPA: hypothetical protein PKE03_06600 [Bacteroidales bacterium]|nr:hypothetical protein [Bacteroidales bacterium]
MIRFFRSSFLIQYLALLLLAAVLWLPAFLRAVRALPPSDNEPLYQLLYMSVAGTPLLSTILAFILMMIGGFLFNAMLSLHTLIPRNSTYGLLFWVIVAGSFPAAMSFQPLWPSMLVLLFALNLAFSMYEQLSNSLKLFNLGVLVSIAGMLHGGAWVFFLWIFAVLFIIRLNQLREWLIPVVGIFLPVVYLLVFWFLKNVMLTKSGLFLLAFIEGFSLPQMPEPMQMVILLLLFVLFVNALNFNYGFQADRNIAVRKRKAMINAFLIVSMFALFFHQGAIQANAFFIIPFSAHLAIWAGGLSRTSRPSIIMWLYVLLVAANNVLYFFSHAQTAIR